MSNLSDNVCFKVTSKLQSQLDGQKPNNLRVRRFLLIIVVILILVNPVSAQEQVSENPDVDSFQVIRNSIQLNPEFEERIPNDTNNYKLAERFSRQYLRNTLVGVFNSDGTIILLADGGNLKVFVEKNEQFKLYQTIRLGFQIHSAAWAAKSNMFAIRFFNMINLYKWEEIKKIFVLDQQVYDIEIKGQYARHTLKFSNNDSVLISVQSTVLVIIEKDQNQHYSKKQQIQFRKGKRTRCDIAPSGKIILCANQKGISVIDYLNNKYIPSRARYTKFTSDNSLNYEFYVTFYKSENAALLAFSNFVYRLEIRPYTQELKFIEQLSNSPILEYDRVSIIGGLLLLTQSTVNSIVLAENNTKLVVMLNDALTVYQLSDDDVQKIIFRRFRNSASFNVYSQISSDGSKILILWDDSYKKPELWRRTPPPQMQFQPGTYPIINRELLDAFVVQTWRKKLIRNEIVREKIVFDLVT